MDLPITVGYNDAMSERVERLLAEARAWCEPVRGRQSELAAFLGVSRQAVSAWFADKPKKQPTAEQALAIQEFLRTVHREEKQ
jgi:transcriptional regulator with XRE-family HTH domain